MSLATPPGLLFILVPPHFAYGVPSLPHAASDFQSAQVPGGGLRRDGGGGLRRDGGGGGDGEGPGSYGDSK